MSLILQQRCRLTILFCVFGYDHQMVGMHVRVCDLFLFLLFCEHVHRSFMFV